MAADRKSLNREAIEAFAAQFTPPLKVVGTKAVGGNRVAHGWMCALHMPEHEIGLTAVCWGKGHFKAWLEATGSHDEAAFAGQVMAEVMDMLKQPSGPEIDPIASAAHAKALEASEEPDDTFEAVQSISPQTEQLEALAESAPPEAKELPKQPNPTFIDMMGLSSLERAKVCDLYPDLRFSINAGQRYDANGEPNDKAGFITGDQLEHVNRVIGGRRLYSEDPTTCEHKFKKNSIGGGSTCIRCGVSAPPNVPNAAA